MVRKRETFLQSDQYLLNTSRRINRQCPENVLKIYAHLATRVQPLRNDGVYRQPREYEASDELEVDHPQSELDAFILSEYPMPAKKTSK